MLSVFTALIIAVLAPFLWGLINIIDKFVVSHKVKSLLGFIAIVGFLSIIFGGLLALFLDWSALSFYSILFPAIAGIFFGASYFVYYLLINKEDASKVIGFLYVYPIVVSLLSFIFLNEIISPLGYIGAAITIIGVLLLTTRVRAITQNAIAWLVFCMIVVNALSEFFVKMATTALPVLNGLAVNLVFGGIALLFVFLSANARNTFFGELKNAKWALLNGSMLFICMLAMYVTMAALPATVVTSLAAIQPLAVLLLEKVFHNAGISICKDVAFSKKLLPLLLIVLGVILLYVQALLKSAV